ncbi:Nif3-like dinuclear metal center hexameric protein [Mesobacillus maritimus]|uniref:Nif3-like dinuclear metal center hexameric protein n=1 Tax=Mesobacillus maritimus TaxID=1643336 RepID=UPI00384A7C1D
MIQQLTASEDKLENTVDTLKYGSPDMEVTGVTVSFMPTYGAIKKTVELGANLLITHEGLFYSHWDQNDLEENRVLEEKHQFIKDSGISIYRIHDYIHRYKPDGITMGLVRALNWDQYVEEYQPAASILNIPSVTTEEVVNHVKDKLQIDYLRYVGNLTKRCTRVGILAEFRGGGPNVIPLFERHQLALVLYGEGPEWETPEYVRDSIAQGKDKSLIILVMPKVKNLG